MRYNGSNLEDVLKAHERWLNEAEGWSENDRADFSGTNLYRADLHGLPLCYALMDDADLSYADLHGANLQNASLYHANLRGANICDTNMKYANLYMADLRNAILLGANLHDACLYEADLNGAIDIPFIPMACPDTGEFIAWKKCIVPDDMCRSVIVKLLIPADAKRSSATGRKCRADKAIVLGIETLNGEPSKWHNAYSMYNSDFVYTVGKTVTPIKPFCENRFDECSSGIHFYVNREEAVRL